MLTFRNFRNVRTLRGSNDLSLTGSISLTRGYTKSHLTSTIRCYSRNLTLTRCKGVDLTRGLSTTRCYSRLSLRGYSNGSYSNGSYSTVAGYSTRCGDLPRSRGYSNGRRSYSNGKRGPVSGMKIAPEVAQALSDGTPVVALESTIITHGFPYPANLDMARDVEQTIRDNGCVPATCAFIGGRPFVGLQDSQLQYLAEAKGVNKVSRRDIGVTMAQSLNGGTTIAGTMILAHMAGIQVFATGGLGGVHRDGHITMDVSADLTELARTPTTVVCAGPKSILDIPRTLEYLETQGVFVGTYNDDGRANVEVPGFFCRDSGVLSPYSFSSWDEIAAIVYNHNSVMGLTSGTLVCVPPPEDMALQSDYIDEIIEYANEEAFSRGISGKALTPFLLQRIAAETNGLSVECNKNFVLNNALAGTKIAKALLTMDQSGEREARSGEHGEGKDSGESMDSGDGKVRAS